MVTAPLATVSIKIDIPPAQAPTTPSKPPTYISISNDGQLFVSFATGPTSTEMHPTTLDTMAASVAQSLGVPNPTTQQVFIRADPHVKYGVFMGVVNRLQIDGYYKIGLISEEVQS
jgi:biopolymer transport protein ExbD